MAGQRRWHLRTPTLKPAINTACSEGEKFATAASPLATTLRRSLQLSPKGIIEVGAISIITLDLKNMELRGKEGVWAAGNYSVTVKDKPIQGNWFRILKRENGTWKIGMDAFARVGVMDAPPAATNSSPPPAKSK
jgi:hypothetical protein